MDKVFIRGLEIETIIGIHGWERQLPRPLILNLEMGVDTRDAAASDQVRDAVDYDAVTQAVRRVAGKEQPGLLETLAEKIARALFDSYPILSLKLAIDKPGAVAGVKAVGIEIDRRREDYAVCGR
ncbi:dihydroneopterin aldolase [Solimonas terrae]|uniref:7,8-dihydroneopterin aldolase n=1 Tax=Solimonas terrae TaxID=1396819 RepID=A0A6M2BR11_9GAMM|nr:dihydroneopterin aldolase [Solimonas terrae]NGY04784.1 dihydroneopterin aldolase [Solimonas terrae]